LQIFSAIADTGGTTAAGQAIGLSQSAASAALAELEEGLGVVLFDRVGRRLLLNGYGRALLPKARALLATVVDIERHHAPAPVYWRIAASTTIGNYLLPARLAALRQANPQAQVDLVIGNTRNVTAAVQRLEVDIGLIEGTCHTAGLETHLWQHDELVIVYGSAHPQAALWQSGADIVQLQQACWLLREPGSGTGEALAHMLLPHVHRFNKVWQLGSTEAIKQCAVAGLGLACLSRYAVADLVALGKLHVLSTPLPPLTRPLWVLHHPGKHIADDLWQLLNAMPPHTPLEGSIT